MKKILFAFTLALSLSACTLLGLPTTYTLGKQPAGGALSSSGTVTVTPGSMVMTTARVAGLAPNTFYVAHYHLQGTASADPCRSGGAPIMSSKMVGMTDASGLLTLSGSVPRSDVMAATYYNIHTAQGADGTPADAGVACTTVSMR